MNNKLSAYFGFATKARKLQRGYKTCLSLLDSSASKVKLLIVATDASEKTIKKMTEKCKSRGISSRVFGSMAELSKITGGSDNYVYAITDENFADAIIREIDSLRKEDVHNE